MYKAVKKIKYNNKSCVIKIEKFVNIIIFYKTKFYMQ